MLASPRLGARRVASIDSVVVLPAPFGPSSPKSSPRPISRSIPRTASTGPYRCARPSIRIGAPPPAIDCRGSPISIPEAELDPEIVGIPTAGATDCVTDVEVDGLERGGEVRRDRPVGPDLAVEP